jgi:putative transposase
MRELGLRGAVRGRRYRTTIPDAGHVRAADLVGREFHASAPNRLRVMDFTYAPTWSGMAYVAFIID